MNTSVIQKCITELQKESPDLSYLRGMLETLLDMQSDPWQRIPVDNSTTHINASSISPGAFPSLGKVVTADSPEGMAVEAALASLGSNVKPNLNSLTLEKNITLN